MSIPWWYQGFPERLLSLDGRTALADCRVPRKPTKAVVGDMPKRSELSMPSDCSEAEGMPDARRRLGLVVDFFVDLFSLRRQFHRAFRSRCISLGQAGKVFRVEWVSASGLLLSCAQRHIHAPVVSKDNGR